VSSKVAFPPAMLSDSLVIAVQLGLLEFWQKALPGDTAVVSLLESSAREALNTATLPTWSLVVENLQQQIEKEKPSSPLTRIIKDYRLSVPQLFNLALLGEVEASHIVNLAITELQHPDKNPRPTIHFLSALLESLFVDAGSADISIGTENPVITKSSLNSKTKLTVFDIAEQTLVHQQVLYLHGEGPLPLKRLAIEPCFWSVLCNRPAQWPGCVPLNHDSAATLPKLAQEELNKVKPLLDRHRDNEATASTVILRGNPNSGRKQFAEELARCMGLQAVLVPVDIWREHPAFAALCRYANWLPVIQPEVAPGSALALPEHQFQTPLVIIIGTDGAVEIKDTIEVTLELPTFKERQHSWINMLGNKKLGNQLAASALLSDETIKAVAGNALRLAEQQNRVLSLSHIAEARQKLGAEKLRLLAQPVFRQVSSDALIMPSLVQENLDAVILRARKRESLWQGMGETLQATPSPGVRALFVGESGTGKTLAASYISTALTAPLYRVDLSAVMNKYIGESEKNLSMLLDQAAATDVVLLFDEADALFGSRTDGKETGERYANMLTNFLLTRIETHPGIVILTTNSSERIDNAFNRRIDTVVEFPLPGYEQRLQLWRSHLGKRGPGEPVYRNLASYCDLAGGQVRNVVLTAAVYAENTRITSADLWQGLRAEYNKLGRELPHKLNFLNVSSHAA
jgi:hypothetical protein